MNIKDIYIRCNVREEDYTPYLEIIETAIWPFKSRLESLFSNYERFRDEWTALVTAGMVNPEAANGMLMKVHQMRQEAYDLLAMVESTRDAVYAYAWQNSEEKTQEAKKQDATLASLPIREIGKRLEGQIKALGDMIPYLYRLAFDGFKAHEV